MKAVGIVTLLLVNVCFAFGQKEMNLVPMPVEVKLDTDIETYSLPFQIVYDDKESDLFNALFLKLELNKLGIAADIKTADSFDISASKIMLFADEENSSERYDIIMPGRSQIMVHGSDRSVFYGIQTLLQLIADAKNTSPYSDAIIKLPNISIKDYPRFQYRGMHLDVCRHFMPVELVKKYIDYLAMYKFNTFHWHLTEDQGWRIEIKKYPKLTEVGGWRNGTIIGAYPGTGNDSIPHGGFYTQEQIKEVVQYAADRYITIIPEIELPGHSSAAIAAYPELSCFPNEDTKYPAECAWAGPTKGKQVQQTWGVFEDVFCPTEYTFSFLQDVLDEVMELFPSRYIHIGGDECPKDSWKRSAFCQQLMKEKGLKDEHELQSYFIQRIEKYINSKGKKIIGWDEILEGGLAPNATVMSWRGEAGGIAAAKQQHDVIMTPENPLYINHSQTKNEDSITQGGYNPIEAVYNYEPIPKELTSEEGKYILGAQGNVWSEYIDSKSKLEYTIFPRMAALAEVLWTPKEKRSWKDFERRLPVIMERLDKEKINYSKAHYELETKVLPTKDFDGVKWVVETKLENPTIIMEDSEDGYGTWKYGKSKNIDTIFSQVADGLYLGDLTFTIKSNMVRTSTDFRRNLNTKKILSYNYVKASVYDSIGLVDSVGQLFHFNKATGKKITLSSPASSKYPGDGAFTLVNGVQNTKGLSKSSEFLGFAGTDCQAIIDLGKTDSIRKVTVHALNDNGAWIWKPSAVEVFASGNGIDFSAAGTANNFVKTTGANGTITVSFNSTATRFVKVLVKNWGIIPPGNSGSGSKSWLFIDEIEVE